MVAVTHEVLSLLKSVFNMYHGAADLYRGESRGRAQTERAGGAGEGGQSRFNDFDVEVR